MSVPHSSIPLCSARKVTMRMPDRDTTPEYTESIGVSVLFIDVVDGRPHVAILEFVARNNAFVHRIRGH